MAHDLEPETKYPREVADHLAAASLATAKGLASSADGIYKWLLTVLTTLNSGAIILIAQKHADIPATAVIKAGSFFIVGICVCIVGSLAATLALLSTASDFRDAAIYYAFKASGSRGKPPEANWTTMGSAYKRAAAVALPFIALLCFVSGVVTAGTELSRIPVSAKDGIMPVQ